MSVFVAGGLKRHRSLFLFLWFLLSIPHQSFKVMCYLHTTTRASENTKKLSGEDYIFLMIFFFWLIAFHQFFCDIQKLLLSKQ